MQGRTFENPDKIKTYFWLVEVLTGKETGAFVFGLPATLKPKKRYLLKGPKMKIRGPFKTAQALDDYLGIPPMPAEAADGDPAQGDPGVADG